MTRSRLKAWSKGPVLMAVCLAGLSCAPPPRLAPEGAAPRPDAPGVLPDSSGQAAAPDSSRSPAGDVGLLVPSPADSTSHAGEAEAAPVDTVAAAEIRPDDIPPKAPSEPWHLTGDRLQGRIDGPIEIDRPYIVHEGLQLQSLHGRWDPGLSRAELHGEVSIWDSVRVMNSNDAYYYREQALLEMEGQVSGKGPEGTIRCQRLTYDREQEILHLSGAVSVVEGTRELQADWVRYGSRDSVLTAGGSIRLVDEADSVEAFGDSFHHDRHTGVATIVSDGTRRPRLVRPGEDGSAPFVLEADTLRLWTEEERGEASGAIHFTRGGITGRCDRASLPMAEDRLLLTGSPEVGDRDGWVTGDSMIVNLRDGLADNLRVWGRARAEYFPPGRVGEAHFTVGDSIQAFLDEGAIRSAIVEGNAQSLYLPREEDADEGVGLNWTRGNRLRLLMQDEGVGRVQFEGDVSGRYVLPLTRAEREIRRGARDSLKVERDSVLAVADTVAAEAAPDSIAPRRLAVRAPVVLPEEVIDEIRALARGGDLALRHSALVALGFKPAETVEYRGREIDFDIETDCITIRGEGQVTYQGMQLDSQEIVFDSRRDLVIAKGEPVLRDPGTEVFGEEMTYRIDTRQGLIFQGRSEFEGGHYRGERVKRVEDKTLYAQNADFTPCECETAMTHFHADRMKIISGDKVIARPVILYLGHIPVMAIPYAVFPIRKGRHSGILVPDVEFGFDSERGRFLRNVGYYLAPNDYWDALLWMDYYENDPRFTFNGKMRYRLRYLLSGRFESSFTQDRSGGGRRDRWLLNANHDQTLGERFSLKASARFQSDKDYADDRDFGASVDDRINRELRSQLSLNKSWSGASMSLAADRTEYLDESGGSTRIRQSIPSINLNLNSFPLGSRADDRGRGGSLPFLSSTYARVDLKYRGVYTKTWEDSVNTNQAAGLGFTLSDKRRLLGAVNITPSASVSAAWAHKDDDGDRNRTGATWRTGLSANTTLYGTFFPHLGAWEGVRHVVELGASYGYRPEIEAVEGFPSVGGISLSSSKSSSVSLSMTQRLHMKWLRGEEAVKKENLITWSTRTSYDFLAKEKDRDPWGNMSHSIRFTPAKAIKSDFSLTHDLEQWKRSQLSLRTNLQVAGGGGAAGPAGASGDDTGAPSGEDRGFGDVGLEGGSGPDRQVMSSGLTGPWRLSATHVFSLGDAWSSHRSSINVASELAMSPAWRLRYTVYYDLAEQEVTSQSYSVYRDLGCWQAVLERRRSGGRSSYFFRISVKDLPDLKYERQRR